MPPCAVVGTLLKSTLALELELIGGTPELGKPVAVDCWQLSRKNKVSSACKWTTKKRKKEKERKVQSFQRKKGRRKKDRKNKRKKERKKGRKPKERVERM